ncbi:MULTISPECIES: hypothetical protein [unclassified Microcoleus]|uniref:hypothetical protein n=1 Tax=unclassified Microcoleus TaxID=2642155 RepID=UPI002FD4FC62
MKIKSLIANVGVTAVLTLVPPSSGSILHMVEKAALSITVVEYVTKLLDKND